jgi:hypothetical protein
MWDPETEGSGSETLCPNKTKQNINEKAEVVAGVIECLPSVHELLGSIPKKGKKEKEKLEN